MIKVFIADDHQLFLEGISELVKSIDGVDLVGTAHDGKEALNSILQTPVDVVLLDINMPKMNGLEVLKKLRASFDSIKVVMLTMHNSRKVVEEVLEAGAQGYLLKNSEKHDLAAGIKAVYAGETYFVDEVKNAVLNGYRASGAQNEVRITPREKEVLQLICQENTTQEIADKLFLSINTIESHRKNLLAKTGAKNSIGLVKFAYENELF